eukprot:246882-Amphidinium_carterae.1
MSTWKTSTKTTFEAKLTLQQLKRSTLFTSLRTSGKSVVEPPVAKVRRIELVHIPKKTFELPSAQDQA